MNVKQLSVVDQKSLVHLKNCWVAIFKGNPPTLFRDGAGTVVSDPDQINVQLTVNEILGESAARRKILYYHISPIGELTP